MRPWNVRSTAQVCCLAAFPLCYVTLHTAIGNDIRQTNLPDIRIQFRSELLGDEFRSLHHHTKLTFDESLIDRIM